VVGTGISPTSRTVAATVSQYTAFLTISDFLTDTAIDPLVENHADLLGYQAGLSVDTITRNVIDAESSSTNQTLLSAFFRVADLRNSRHALQAIDVQPMEDGQFYCILHPYVSYDLVNDPAAGGLADIVKYTDPKGSPLVKYEDRGLITSVAGVRVVESTNVFTQTGPNRYRAYVFGKDGIGCVDLAGRGPSKVSDPKKQRFNVNIIRPESGSMADPERVIGAAVSYNFIYTAVVLDGPAGIGGVYRYKTLDPQSSIA
jgi:N4-gp56 family major capsid protein